MAMPFAPGPTSARELNQRARFDALRRRVFAEMGQDAARWRLTWILPFNVFVVGLLVLRGEPWPRAAVQIVAVLLIAITFFLRARSQSRAVTVGCFLTNIVTFFALVSTTGGLASPLLIIAGVIVVSVSLTLHEPRWLRHAAFLGFLGGFVALALLSRTAVGALVGSLAGDGVYCTADHVIVALTATLFAMFGVHKIGCAITRGYERAALELAERREELCIENQDQARALEGMAARLAHEVKNPLAAIKGLSVHMSRNATDPAAAERLAIVAAEADRLQSIVDGFLSFSRGLDDLNLAPVRPFEVARELSVLLETRAEEAGVALAVTGAEDLVLEADPRKLRQALLNLVLNAIQASPREATVRISVARECERALLTVHDDGVGMSQDVLERIRKPYFTTKEGGTGLGVAVARGLVEQHGGRLEFRSTAGKGTTATISLPTKAKPCARLPNPLRAIKHEGALQEAEKAAPAVAGAR
jgi:signal transduction histidine kinase